MKTTLSNQQIDKLHSLIYETIMPALYEDGIIEPDMSDVKLDDESDEFHEEYTDRQTELLFQAIEYIKKNAL